MCLETFLLDGFREWPYKSTLSARIIKRMKAMRRAAGRPIGAARPCPR